MAATAWLMLSFSSCIVRIWFVYSYIRIYSYIENPPLEGEGGGPIFLWEHLKSTMYESNPHTIQELNDNVSHTVAAIKVTMLHRIWFVYSYIRIYSYIENPPLGRGGQFFSGDTWKVPYTNQICTRYRKWRTSVTQLQPSISLCYIGYTSTWLGVRSCVLMQEATTSMMAYPFSIWLQY